MEVYLDNSATTKCYDEVGELVRKIMCEDYGNPSSLHLKGIEAERYLKKAAEDIGNILKVDSKEIIFTSGGTESDNLAIIGGAKANYRAGKHIITTEIEHPAVENSMKFLEEEGFEITYLPVDKAGIVNLQSLRDALRPDTILVSIVHVNNEIGSVQPLELVGKIVKEYNSKILIHSDGVQGFGKLLAYPKKWKIDMYSVSGHKIHGPKGVGLLYKEKTAKILPLSFGGNQQKGLRSGTDNVPGVVGLGLAAKMMYQDLEHKQKRLFELKRYFIERLLEIENVYINGFNSDVGTVCQHDGVGGDVNADASTSVNADAQKSMAVNGNMNLLDINKSVPHIISAAFKGISSEVLLHALEEKGIYVSSGSACSSYSKKKSNTLVAIGAPKEYQESTIRFSMSEFTTKEEIDYTLETLYNSVPVLRRFIRK